MSWHSHHEIWYNYENLLLKQAVQFDTHYLSPIYKKKCLILMQEIQLHFIWYIIYTRLG